MWAGDAGREAAYSFERSGRMKKLTVRLVIAAITFCVGVAVAALWLVRHRSPEQTPALVSSPSMAQSALPSARPVSRDEEYAIYSVLLNRISISPEDGGKIKLLVINDQTSVDKVTEHTPEEIFRSYKEPLTPALSAALLCAL
jgi:hypothetical protein